MRKNRRILIWTFVVCMLLSFPAHAKKLNYKKIYGKVLKQDSITVVESGVSYKYGPIKYFTLIDINRDGKKELFATNYSGGGQRVYFIYTIRSKKAKLLTHSYAWFSDNAIEYNKPKKSIIIHQHGGTGLSGREVYKLSKGRIVRVAAMEEYHTYENNKSVIYYSKYIPKGKYGAYIGCSKATYYKLYNKYCSKVKTRTLFANTETNRKKRLK